MIMIMPPMRHMKNHDHDNAAHEAYENHDHDEKPHQYNHPVDEEALKTLNLERGYRIDRSAATTTI